MEQINKPEDSRAKADHERPAVSTAFSTTVSNRNTSERACRRRARRRRACRKRTPQTEDSAATTAPQRASREAVPVTSPELGQAGSSLSPETGPPGTIANTSPQRFQFQTPSYNNTREFKQCNDCSSSSIGMSSRARNSLYSERVPSSANESLPSAQFSPEYDDAVLVESESESEFDLCSEFDLSCEYESDSDNESGPDPSPNFESEPDVDHDSDSSSDSDSDAGSTYYDFDSSSISGSGRIRRNQIAWAHLKEIFGILLIVALFESIVALLEFLVSIYEFI
ncbi:hypothetical protein FSARC_4845 [Fusarium sarcochroum]|uniref:Uncharacterized protein n=1 Tax=Fusarium sarcochroum TaxID=1208366 RepID=A0A8H4U0R2_9HYPO|nr:hypothetical protein FSARC_4845 [Fusarium sarcochroum]